MQKIELRRSCSKGEIGGGRGMKNWGGGGGTTCGEGGAGGAKNIS